MWPRIHDSPPFNDIEVRSRDSFYGLLICGDFILADSSTCACSAEQPALFVCSVCISSYIRLKHLPHKLSSAEQPDSNIIGDFTMLPSSSGLSHCHTNVSGAAQPDSTAVRVLVISSLQTVQLVLAVLNSLPPVSVLSALHVPGRASDTCCRQSYRKDMWCSTSQYRSLATHWYLVRFQVPGPEQNK